MKFFINSCDVNTDNMDCIIVGIFEEYKLSISAKYLDTCSNGYINSLIKSGDITGKIGQSLLLHNIPNLFCKRILLVGCGKKSKLNRNNFSKILKNTINILRQTKISKVIYCFTELQFENYDIYWMVRIFIQNITEFLYTICKIDRPRKKNTNLNFVYIHIVNLKDIVQAETAVKHGLAIDKGVTAAKNISNLPPNICTPMYLSHKAIELSQRFKDNISTEVINAEKMKILGMNSYLAVSRGSQYEPCMSVIKYAGNNIGQTKTIVLIGKGLTFDSGGISLKSSHNMHEMKYDMCGSSAVYGTMIMAAMLKLPLTVIGVLAGCENMPGGNSFRPGDVLTTMSGKTVEILNTDAEGRLVLCDVLTYVEKFSPNIVIDIATLTGACVVALGNLVSGCFSNNSELVTKLKKASTQSNDKIWELPLYKEYRKELNSNIADLSNVGTSQAGAITAAYFLSLFASKYHWAHLDIAGTAWKSGCKFGATGRPVELLCQFLLNESNDSNYIT